MFTDLLLEKEDGRWYYSALINGRLLFGTKDRWEDVFAELKAATEAEEALTIDI